MLDFRENKGVEEAQVEEGGNGGADEGEDFVMYGPAVGDGHVVGAGAAFWKGEDIARCGDSCDGSTAVEGDGVGGGVGSGRCSGPRYLKGWRWRCVWDESEQKEGEQKHCKQKGGGGVEVHVEARMLGFARQQTLWRSTSVLIA